LNLDHPRNVLLGFFACPTCFSQVLELLLSQERVISLLYDRALPPRMSFGGFGGIADLVTAGEIMCCCSVACCHNFVGLLARVDFFGKSTV
jgi:hypothetical protein